ncbi:N-6 DNA methylase [Salmonella enterica subsp. enterica]|nr:N-6 DNA methylase [Salmonella enterica subsp. enterica]
MFRGGAEERIRRKVLEDGTRASPGCHLPANLFFSTGIPVHLVLKSAKAG